MIKLYWGRVLVVVYAFLMVSFTSDLAADQESKRGDRTGKRLGVDAHMGCAGGAGRGFGPMAVG